MRHRLRRPDRSSDLNTACYAAVLEAAPVAMVVLDLSGVVVGWNTAAERLYRLRAVEVLGRPFDTLMTREGRVEFGAALARLRRGEPVDKVSVMCGAKDGRHRSIRVHLVPVIDRGGEVVAAVCNGASTDALLAGANEDPAAERFRRLFAANVFGICGGEHDLILEGNDAFLETIGAQRDDLASGLPLATIFAASVPAPETFVDTAPREYEIRRLDGTPAYVLWAELAADDEPRWLAVTLDLTQRKAAERKIAYLALHDPATGLPNRRLLIDRLEHALARAHRQEATVGVLFCDLDRFKQTNDTHGHHAGDVVLQTVAHRLEGVLRDDDTVARVGGDEFVVVLEELPDPTVAIRIAERARAAVREPIPFDDHELTVTASVGVALSSGPADHVDDLLRRADDAMYIAKQHGRDQIACDTHDFSARASAANQYTNRNDHPSGDAELYHVIGALDISAHNRTRREQR